MPDKIDDANGALGEFAKNRDINTLEKAVDAIEEFDFWSVKPEERLAARRRLLLTCAKVLVAIDGIKDPSYDPKSPPSMYPSPPPGYPAGVTPQSVRDPAARARYEAAIAGNEKKKAARRTQLLAEEFENRAVEKTRRIIERLYTSSAADQKEIEAVFEEARLSPARRQQVRSAN